MDNIELTKEEFLEIYGPALREALKDSIENMLNELKEIKDFKDYQPPNG